MNLDIHPVILAVVAGLVGAVADIAAAHEPQPHGVQHHERRAVPSGRAVPSLSLSATADRLGGYNLEVTATNFRFSPENTGRASDGLEGHAHLYLNGEKKARLYGPWFHVPGGWLAPGDNVLRVTLNDNLHADWTAGGEPIAGELRIAVPEEWPGRLVEIHVGDGAAAQTVRARKGERLRVLVHCSGEEELHLHGYDLTATAQPSEPAVFEVTADHAGRFPLVRHGGKGLLGRGEVPVAYLEVRGG